MPKRMTTIKLSDEAFEIAKENRINVSEAAEDAILRMRNREELAEYLLELAELDPEHYWIKPLDGKCHKRGKPMFFDVDPQTHKVFEITKEEYIQKYRHRVANGKAEKIKMTMNDLEETWHRAIDENDRAFEETK